MPIRRGLKKLQLEEDEKSVGRTVTNLAEGIEAEIRIK